MTEVVNLDDARLELKIKKGFKNWMSRFDGDFGISTRISDFKNRDLAFFADGDKESAFYVYGLIININYSGSGLLFDELAPLDKIAVIDIQLFLLDRIRYEYMKRLGWIDCYPGEEYTLAELILDFNDLAPGIQATPPELSNSHPDYPEYMKKNIYEKEETIRKLVPEALNRVLP